MKAGGIIAAGWGERLQTPTPKALTTIGPRKLIDFALDGLQAAGVEQITCIVNEAARSVCQYVDNTRPDLDMDWIIQTTPSSMHSFLLVLERLSQHRQDHFFLTTVDSVCPATEYQQFEQTCRLFEDADVCLGLTRVVDDEKPLRVAMRGESDTGLLPERVQDNPAAWEIVAMTDTGFASDYVTAGFYHVSPRVLLQKATALKKDFSALRQFLGHLLKYGHRFYGVPLGEVIDVDRPQDVQAAEARLRQ